MTNEVFLIYFEASGLKMGFLVHALNNLPEEYNKNLDGMQRRLLMSGPEELAIEDAWDK